MLRIAAGTTAHCGCAVGSPLRAGHWRLSLAGAPLVPIPCGHAAGSCPLRARCWQRPYGLAAVDHVCGWLPLASCCPCGWPPLAGGRYPPCRGALATTGRPCRGGWLWPAAPLQGALAAADCPLQPPTASPSSSLFLLRTRRSYIPVFQIRMEKMKEVKHPPL
ncbi:hypothetical protein BHE74_00035698 [Ensete ventricosum]|nr:hypothetical protein GW17_00042757 [Ensete ventricosum]RWW57505.1 hypothetical protein BHE74_00035698 [Ensete ventricosum]